MKDTTTASGHTLNMNATWNEGHEKALQSIYGALCKYGIGPVPEDPLKFAECIRESLSAKDAEIERLNFEYRARLHSVEDVANQHIYALEAENQLLKSNLENANEQWRRVIEERDELESKFGKFKDSGY